MLRGLARVHGLREVLQHHLMRGPPLPSHGAAALPRPHQAGPCTLPLSALPLAIARLVACPFPPHPHPLFPSPSSSPFFPSPPLTLTPSFPLSFPPPRFARGSVWTRVVLSRARTASTRRCSGRPTSPTVVRRGANLSGARSPIWGPASSSRHWVWCEACAQVNMLWVMSMGFVY